MATQLADRELVDTRTQPAAPASSAAMFDSIEDDGRLTAARGIATGVVISLPLWVLIAFTIYMLL